MESCPKAFYFTNKILNLEIFCGSRVLGFILFKAGRFRHSDSHALITVTQSHDSVLGDGLFLLRAHYAKVLIKS